MPSKVIKKNTRAHRYAEKLGMDRAAGGIDGTAHWYMEELFTRSVRLVMLDDALSTSHPVRQPVAHPDEINENFDSISYVKGAALVRMMHHFVSEAAFQSGLHAYLSQYRYDNAEQDDLWRHMTLAMRRTLDNRTSHASAVDVPDVKRVMDSWTLQTGFPLVTIERDYLNGSARAVQQRFPPKAYRKDVWWHVPLTWLTRYGSRQVEMAWLQNGSVTLQVPSAGWLLANVRSVGYYRVNYDADNWRLLAEALRDVEQRDSIDPINRAQVLDDVFALAK